MAKLRFFLLALSATALCGQTLAIRNASIVDPANGSVRRSDLIVTGATIKTVGPKARAIKTSQVLNASGKFIIPGLWDMHVHLWESEPMFSLYTAHGVTGIRDMGSDYDRTRRWAREALTGSGPTVITSGSPIDGPESGASKFPVVRVSDGHTGRRAVDQLDDSGVDFIKVLSSTPRDAYFALAQRARVRRAIFAGHVPESVRVMEAIDNRQRSIDHMFGLALACSSEEMDLRAARADAIQRKDNTALREIRQRTYATFSEPGCMELLRRMGRYGTAQVPTLTLRQRLSLINLDKLATDPLAKRVPKAVRESWTDPRKDAEGVGPEALERFRQDYDFHARLIPLMRRAGVEILAGTDTGDPYVIPGAALHDELELLVAAGLTNAEALATATTNAARYFDLERTHGSIAPGKVADLVVLDANPLENIRNTRRIHAVVVRGKLVRK